LAVAVLAVFGSLSGRSQAQGPVSPAVPQTEPAAPPPAVPKAESAPPVTAAPVTPAPASRPIPKAGPAAPPAPTGESTPGVVMIQDILASLGRYEQEGRPAKQKLGFEIPERAFNEYLAYTLRTRPRPGIAGMTVALLPNNQISSDVEIDFDAVQKWNPEIFPEILRPVLIGKRSIHTDVKFDSNNGSCSFSLKGTQGPDGKAIVNKVMSAVLQALGSRQPESYDTAKPLPLPFGLKRIWTEKQLICGET
jgi:hypothetical protein